VERSVNISIDISLFFIVRKIEFGYVKGQFHKIKRDHEWRHVKKTKAVAIED